MGSEQLEIDAGDLRVAQDSAAFLFRVLDGAGSPIPGLYPVVKDVEVKAGKTTTVEITVP